MDLTEEHRHGLNIALNEAELFGFEVDPSRRLAAATFNVLTLPVQGPPPSDRRVQMLFSPVGRVAASFCAPASMRHRGKWRSSASKNFYRLSRNSAGCLFTGGTSSIYVSKTCAPPDNG